MKTLLVSLYHRRRREAIPQLGSHPGKSGTYPCKPENEDFFRGHTNPMIKMKTFF